MDPPKKAFNLALVEEVREAFSRHRVRYLFIGKGGAIILGFPGTTQDVDLFIEKSPANAQNILLALSDLGFEVTPAEQRALLEGRDFIRVSAGPFDIDLIHAPDGIENFEVAFANRHEVDGFPVANLRDIIQSKKAANRMKDRIDLYLLESFRAAWERNHPKPLTRFGNADLDVG